MSRLLKNNTESAIVLDIGHTVPASGQLEIIDENVLLFQKSDDMWASLASEDLTYNDGVSDLGMSDAINHLKNLMVKYPTDTDGSQLSRVKITKTGWGLQCHSIGVTTGKVDSIYDKKHDGTDYGFGTLKFYDSEDDEITEKGTYDTLQDRLDAECETTALLWEPTHDLEIIGGELWQKAKPASAVRMWFYHPLSGHEFCTGGIDLQFIDNKKSMDGRAPKLLPYSAAYHSSQLCMKMKHTAGVNHDVQLVLEIFKA